MFTYVNYLLMPDSAPVTWYYPGMLSRSRVLSSPITLLAHGVSALLQPTITIVPLLMVLNGLSDPNVSVLQWFVWCCLTVTFTTTLPSIAILALLRLGLISDLNITDRKERPLPYVLMIACYLMGTEVAHLAGVPHRSVLVLFAGALSLIGAAFVNQRYFKISIHTLSVALLVVAVTVAFGPATLPVFALLAGVWWARVTLRAHSPHEATAGALLGLAIGVVVFTLL